VRGPVQRFQRLVQRIGLLKHQGGSPIRKREPSAGSI
jgi:hypothetical protein